MSPGLDEGGMRNAFKFVRSPQWMPVSVVVSVMGAD